MSLLLLTGSVIVLLLAPPDYARLLTPLLTMVNLGALYVAILWKLDGRLPLFEAGTLCVAATLIYGLYPFVEFMLAGLQWGTQADFRLRTYHFDLDEIAAFAWRYVTYLSSFIVVYLLVRNQHGLHNSRPQSPPARLVIVLLLLLFLGYLVKWGLVVAYGLNPDVPYSEIMQQINRAAQIPHVIQQLTFPIVASILLLKQALLIPLFQRWRSARWRALLLGWLATEAIVSFVRMGSRNHATLLLLSAAVLYHHLVRPLRLRWVLAGGSILLTGFLLQGVLRSGPLVTANGQSAVSRVFAGYNEFQVLFANAFDIYRRKQSGTLGPVPWQLQFVDAYLIVPSQLLPFYKWDPSEWYLEVLGLRGSGLGLMFGVMAQAMIGWDWIELTIRGALLGLILAALHRWYVRHSSGFWPTLFYLFVSIWTYYTFRSTTFWILHYVVYQFLPVMLAAKLIETIVMATIGRSTGVRSASLLSAPSAGLPQEAPGRGTASPET